MVILVDRHPLGPDLAIICSILNSISCGSWVSLLKPNILEITLFEAINVASSETVSTLSIYRSRTNILYLTYF